MRQVSCPYCGSVQVKAMANQPKKYPRPTDPIALTDWQKGYDCKKCGNDFIYQPNQVSESRGSFGYFGKFVKYALIIIAALFVLSFFLESQDDLSEKESADLISAEKPVNQPELEIPSTLEENPLDQEFTKEAEEAVHTPYFDEPKSIKNSEDQNDTLSIKTTLRAKDE